MGKSEVLIIEENSGAKMFPAWDNFVENHPLGTIFQSTGYFSLFKRNSKFRPVAFLLIGESDEISGVLSCIIQYHLPAPFRECSGRCVVMGGPIVAGNDPERAALLMNTFETYMRDNVLYSQFRNLFDTGFMKDLFVANKFEYEEHLDILVDLTKSEGELQNEIHATRRNEIRRAVRKGMELKVIIHPEELKKSYEILKTVYTRIRLPLFPFEIFNEAFSKLYPEGKALFFGAYLDNELIGTMYTFCYKGSLYNFFAGSDPAAYKFFPNSFIPWQVFLWGKRNSVKSFDWGGAGKPGIPYGVRDYKEKFGGSLVNYGRYEKIHKPLFFLVAKSGFAIWKFVRKQVQ